VKIVEAFELGWISNPVQRRKRQTSQALDSDVSGVTREGSVPGTSCWISRPVTKGSRVVVVVLLSNFKDKIFRLLSRATVPCGSMR